MANTTIDDLPAEGALTTAHLVPVDDGVDTTRTTAGAIAQLHTGDFGAAALLTTGYLALGTTPATAGYVRVPYSISATILATKDSGGTDRTVISQPTANAVRFGVSTNLATQLYGAGVTIWGTGGIQLFNSSGSGHCAEFLQSTADHIDLGPAPPAAGYLRLTAATNTDLIKFKYSSVDYNFAKITSGGYINLGNTTFPFQIDSNNLVLSSTTGDTTIFGGNVLVSTFSSTALTMSKPIVFDSSAAATGKIKLAGTGTVEQVVWRPASTDIPIITTITSTNSVRMGGSFAASINTEIRGLVTELYANVLGLAVSSSTLSTALPLAGCAGVSTTFRWKKASITQSSTSDTTLSSSQYECPVLQVTGTPGGDFSIIAPDTTDTFFIVSNGTVNLLTIKKSGGTGIVIGPNATALVRHNGTDYIRVTDDVSSSNTKVTIRDVVANVETTDATVTNLYTFTIPDEAVTCLDVLITAVQSTGATGASYKRTITFRRDGGTVSLIGSARDNQTDEDSAAWDVTVDNSTSTGRVRVTGAAATTIQWGMTGRIQTTVP